MSNQNYTRIIKNEIPDVEFHQNTYARQLEQIVDGNVRWLDIGAGTRVHDGYGIATPSELASACSELVGIDFEEEHLRRNPDLTSFVVGGAEGLPFPDQRFELVTANMVLEHLEQPLKVFQEVSRVLSAGGVFVFITPNLNHPIIRTISAIMRPQTQRLVTHKFEGRSLDHIFPTFYRANTTRSITALAAESDLSIERLEVVRNIPFITKPAFATWLECQTIKLTKYGALSGFAADIIGVLRKKSL